MLGAAQKRHERGRLLKELAEPGQRRPLLAFRQDLAGGLDDRVDDADDLVVFVVDRTVGKGKIGLLFLAVAGQWNEVILEEAGLPGHRLLGDRTHGVPNLAPGHMERFTERIRFFAEERHIGVVEDRDQMLAQEQADRQFRRQGHIDGDLDRHGPGFQWTQRCLAPVEGPDAFAHKAAIHRKLITLTAQPISSASIRKTPNKRQATEWPRSFVTARHQVEPTKLFSGVKMPCRLIE